ncbi:MAG: hypothetical protein WCT10_05730 [Patescibacteria group bacterium]|jgi:hypothetical protein
MNTELITRLIGLIEKTGDKVVLADPMTGKAVVVMDLDAYERLNTAVATPAPAAKTARIAAAPPDTYKEEAELRSERDPEWSRYAEKESAPPVRPQPARADRFKPAEVPRSPRQLKAVQAEKAAPATPLASDLTQDELLDKINREIGAWKNAQEKKRTVELQSAAQTIANFQTTGSYEEEERFYLEPIE